MNEIKDSFSSIELESTQKKDEVVSSINELLKSYDYNIVELNQDKPWGAYFRMDDEQADKFIQDFFNNTDPKDARLGREDVSLSPKILLVSPGQRLSWQYHHRRAEKWTFLTNGGYHKSLSNDEGDLIKAEPEETVQFEMGERHRLTGSIGRYAIVAEIWQHVFPDNPSDENDIVRLQDDYSR